MKILGIVLMVVGALWGIVAFNMSTSVETESRSIGFGEYSTYIPSQSVHNLDLADKRRNHLLLAAVLFVSGSVLFGFGSMQKPANQQPNATSARQEDTRKCPYCAEVVKAEAVICRFCQKELPHFPKKANHPSGVIAGKTLVCPPGTPIAVWRESLMLKHGIKKGVKVDTYVWGEKTFDSFESVVAALGNGVQDNSTA